MAQEVVGLNTTSHRGVSSYMCGRRCLGPSSWPKQTTWMTNSLVGLLYKQTLSVGDQVEPCYRDRAWLDTGVLRVGPLHTTLSFILVHIRFAGDFRLLLLTIRTTVWQLPHIGEKRRKQDSEIVTQITSCQNFC